MSRPRRTAARPRAAADHDRPGLSLCVALSGRPDSQSGSPAPGGPVTTATESPSVAARGPGPAGQGAARTWLSLKGIQLVKFGRAGDDRDPPAGRTTRCGPVDAGTAACQLRPVPGPVNLIVTQAAGPGSGMSSAAAAGLDEFEESMIQGAAPVCGLRRCPWLITPTMIFFSREHSVRVSVVTVDHSDSELRFGAIRTKYLNRV